MNKRTPVKIGLALGSGGWRGLAHIGVIKSLVKHGYLIDAVAGSSAGALIGGLYALWQDIDKVEESFNTLSFKDLLYAFSDPSRKLGLIGGNNTLKLFKKFCNEAQIENLSLWYRAVATDIFSGIPYIFDKGDLSFAIRASSSVPIIFDPIQFQGKLLVDGGIANPLPADIVRSAGVDVVIAVNIYSCIFPITKPQEKFSRLNLAMVSYQFMLNQLAVHRAKDADIIVNPVLENAVSDPFLRFINNQSAIDAGELAMDQLIPSLNELVDTKALMASPPLSPKITGYRSGSGFPSL